MHHMGSSILPNLWLVVAIDFAEIILFLLPGCLSPSVARNQRSSALRISLRVLPVRSFLVSNFRLTVVKAQWNLCVSGAFSHEANNSTQT